MDEMLSSIELADTTADTVEGLAAGTVSVSLLLFFAGGAKDAVMSRTFFKICRSNRRGLMMLWQKLSKWECELL